VKELLSLLAAEGSYHTGSIPRWPLNGGPQTASCESGRWRTGSPRRWWWTTSMAKALIWAPFFMPAPNTESP
jgi:hypothetical protein